MTDVDGKKARPAPVLTEDNVVFWDNARDHRLTAQQCGGCRRLRHPPRPMCPHCHSLAVDYAELSGNGSVYSYSLLHHPQHPAFDYPVVAALIELDEGIRIVSNVVGIDPHDLHVGLRVAVEFRSTDADMAVPVFHPSSR